MEGVQKAARNISSVRKTLIQGKRTQKPHQGMKHLLGWESLLSDLPGDRGRVYGVQHDPK